MSPGGAVEPAPELLLSPLLMSPLLLYPLFMAEPSWELSMSPLFAAEPASELLLSPLLPPPRLAAEPVSELLPSPLLAMEPALGVCALHAGLKIGSPQDCVEGRPNNRHRHGVAKCAEDGLCTHALDQQGTWRKAL